MKLAITIALLCMSCMSQPTPPRVSRTAEIIRPPCTNTYYVSLAWSNSPSPGVVKSVLAWRLAPSINYTQFHTNDAITINFYTASVTYTGAVPDSIFAIKAVDGDGNESDWSNEATNHILRPDYREFVLSGTPPFYMTFDFRNYTPLPVTNSSVTIVNNGSACYFKCTGTAKLSVVYK